MFTFSLVWRDAYKQAISIIRLSGWGGALVIDASAYGQNPDGKYSNSNISNYFIIIFTIF